MNLWDSDVIVQQWLQDNDETSMPMPSMESDPHLLISKVRKHYMEYLIKLLAANYESSQKLINKNIYLPSAIWRCAKLLELSAAKSCMVVQLYRQNVLNVIKELKEMTKKGKLYKQLYTCLRVQPENEKRTQASFTTGGCDCQCSCGLKRKKRASVVQPTVPPDKTEPVKNDLPLPDSQNPPIEKAKIDQTIKVDKEQLKTDDIMQQLEELFHGIPDDDDIFEGAFDMPTTVPEKVTTISKLPEINPPSDTAQTEAQAKNLEDRLAVLSGILSSMDSDVKPTKNNKKPHRTTKWLCEEYFLKVKLYEKLDEIRENRRTKFNKIKNTMIDLFGYDSDGEGVVSPIDETPEFMTSCKERIAPWVVKILNPYYVKGRIRGKALFKSLARHLIKLIYQCSKYPFEYEVQSFVQDFLESHKMIRCEADFEGFKIENV
ncbi:uncharacterized protein LOC121736078 [Aricia agestis]|uniref:uncharacterized protein LOC121736078 n=1 Tax=Aricia agestis TaxID=91739 RepID=UPI001C204BB5|nr:uncharacterized protein LOC121736078 [Aricia agestis]